MHETQPVVVAVPRLSRLATPGKIHKFTRTRQTRTQGPIEVEFQPDPEMKTRQLPAATTTASFRAKQWDAGKIPAGGITCERERKHEIAKREREEQLKREKAATAAAATAAQRVRQHHRIIAERDQSGNRGRPTNPRQLGALRRPLSRPPAVSGKGPKEGPPETLAKAEHAVNPAPNPDPGTIDSKTDRLRIQLEELSKLPEQEFEQGFRRWLDQEGIAREMHSHLRVELINCFNNTALGQLLNKAAGLQIGQMHALLHSPLAMALPTLVAEFLHSQNCHFTLSVFCSEMPHRHTLPRFENRPGFRFRTDELQQVLGAVMAGSGQEAQPDPEFNQIVEGHYLEDLAGQTQSLLMALMRSLVEIRKLAEQKRKQDEEKPPEEPAPPPTAIDCGCQTEPSACLEVRPEVDTSRLYQAEENELVLGADGRSVFVGPRVSQSLHAVEEHMGQLMKNLRLLTKSCVPPVEVISEASFDQLMHRELRERKRLTKAGHTFDPGQPVIKLPQKAPKKKKEKTSKEDEVVQSELGPIILPAGEVELPRMLPLHPEQFSSLAVIQQSLDTAQKKTRQPQGRMFVSVQRMETLMSDVCGCIQLMGNVLNLSMEQEHAVGQRKGFEAGYKEGFGHGHFMGVQEGRQREKHEQSQNKQEASVQVKLHTKSTATQTTRKRSSPKNHIHTQTDAKPMCDAASQVYFKSQKTYEQWIHEMLHTSNGQLFLERVELSLGKALELQKKRLDQLYEVKLRHQAEMFRLSRRQSSWRTLCKRVEQDSKASTETQELVQKIFHLLEHYETHHHQLAVKIQQTEMAAEQATFLVPIWTDDQEETRAIEALAPGDVTFTAGGKVTSIPPVMPSKTVKKASAQSPSVEVPPHPSNSTFGHHSYPHLGYAYHFLSVTPPGEMQVSVEPRLTGHIRFTKGFVTDPGGSRNKAHSTVPRPSILHKKDDAGGAKKPTVSFQEPRPCGDRLGSLTEDKDISPSTGYVPSTSSSGPPKTVSKDPEPPKASAAVPSAAVPSADVPSVDVPSATVAVPSATSPSAPPLSGSSQELKESPLEPKPPVVTPVKPSMHTVGTNTIEPLPPPPFLSLGRSFQGPSFEEALLSAKNRMKQLEEESDLLEKNFLSYLEKSKSNTGKEPPKCRRNLLKAHFDCTLDSFMDWDRMVREEEAASLAHLQELHNLTQPLLDSKVSTPPWLSELEEGQDQDKYHFTNAISEARNKLLSGIGVEKRKEVTEEAELGEKLQPSEDWVPAEVPKVLSVVKPTELSDITPSRSSSTGEMSRLLRRAKEALGLKSPNPLLDSSSDSSSLEIPSVDVAKTPSQKLKQSMAKMELLFGGASESAKPPKSSKPKRTTRPLSAPTTGTENLRLPQRPHTAPTLYPIQELQQDHDLDTTTSTSQSSLPRKKTPAGSFEKLIASAVMGPDSTPKVSLSQEFWKRMNL